MANGILLGEVESGRLGKRAATILASMAGQRLRPLWLLALASWIVFACFRAGLLIACSESLRNVSASEIAQCLLTGLRYDAVPIGCAMLPLAMVLSLASASAFAERTFRRFIMAYGAVLATLVLFVEVVGVAFFLHFGARLNWTSIAYFGHFRELAIYLWNAYPIWLLAIGTVIAPVLCYLLFRRVFWRGRLADAPAWVRPIGAVVLMGLCVLAARGGFDERPVQHDSAYFSENNIIDQIIIILREFE